MLRQSIYLCQTIHLNHSYSSPSSMTLVGFYQFPSFFLFKDMKKRAEMEIEHEEMFTCIHMVKEILYFLFRCFSHKKHKAKQEESQARIKMNWKDSNEFYMDVIFCNKFG